MRVFLLLCAVLLVSACATNTPRNKAALRAQAQPTSVDLSSADGAVFLQGRDAPTPVPGARTRRGLFSQVTVANAPSGAPNTFGAQRTGAGPNSAIVRVSGEASNAAGTTAGRGKGQGDADGVRKRRGLFGLPHIVVHRRDARPKEPPPPIEGGDPPKRRAHGLRDAFNAAYDVNPTINQARASLRAADEGIAIARSNNRPTITATVEAAGVYGRSTNVGAAQLDLDETRTPGVAAVTLSQPLFQGFRSRNLIRQAEANVRAERERLSATEQDVLLNTAIAFLDVRRFRRGVTIREQDVAFLAEQVTAARRRLDFGEGTRTDVAQAETRLAEARAILADERDAAEVSAANFRELTGLDPSTLRQDLNLAPLLPDGLGTALRMGQADNPNIKLAIHEVDEAAFNVKATQGQALPTVTLSGTLETEVNPTNADRADAAEVRLGVSIPIYQGGLISAQVRQAKENLGGARLAVDAARDSVRTSLVSAWSNYRSALVSLDAAEAAVRSARIAVDGTLAELRVGQRTTVDVLNAQGDLLRAQLTVAIAERDRDVSAFAILRGTGALTVDVLGLSVEKYRPTEHYRAVRDKWAGMRTPDGR